ncbi:MAG: 4Fe-4S ferredoxin [Planctomycetota bacterium]|nr:MAG: 4Fe-4S ferredoxin [Planctomycetota bacterium]
MGKTLVIDLDICRECEECNVRCAYYYHPDNVGIAALREMAMFALLCRQCEEASCIAACPRDALEKGEDGKLRRHILRCVGCGSCVIACPFGNLMNDALRFIVAACDLCQDLGDAVPPCVESCEKKALSFEEVKEPLPENMFMVGDRFAVRTSRWEKIELPESKETAKK